MVLGTDAETGKIREGADEGVHAERKVMELDGELAQVGVDVLREDGLRGRMPRGALQLLEGWCKICKEHRRMVFSPLLKVQVIENPVVGVAEEV